MSLKKATIEGVKWSAGAQAIRQLLQFIITVILARLLVPADFGLLGMVVVITGFTGLFSDLGFGPALIQKKSITERHLSSIFWINILTGLVLTGVICITAPFISRFYNEPRLMPIAMLLSTSLFITAFRIVPTSILKRSMDFQKLAIIDTIQIISAGTIAIALALNGFGVWSIAWQMIASAAVTSFLLYWLCNWRPTFVYDKTAVGDLFNFGSNLIGYNLFNYWTRNLDNLLIGKFIGSSGLGYYSRAYTTMLLPITQISSSLGQVMFPSLSRIQDDKSRVKHIYLKTLSMIALISFPMMTGLLVTADSFVLALFGPQWAAVIPILRVLCVVGILQSIGTTVGWIYNSQGRTDRLFQWGIVAGTMYMAAFTVGVLIGSVMAVAVSYTLVNFLLLYHNFTIPGKLVNMNFREVIERVAGIFICASLMACCVFAATFILPANWNHWYRLATQVLLGVSIYTLCIHCFKIRAYIELKKLMGEYFQGRNTRVRSYD